MGKASNAKRMRRETGIDPRRPRRVLPKQGHPDDLPTMWNGEPTECVRCLVIVGGDPSGDAWFADIIGEQRRCVEVRYFEGKPFYLDDEPKAPRADETEQLKALKAAAVEAGIPVSELSVEGYHGWAWDKVTKGRGSPRYGHREVTPASVVGYIDGLGGDPVPGIVEPELTEG